MRRTTRHPDLLAGIAAAYIALTHARSFNSRRPARLFSSSRFLIRSSSPSSPSSPMASPALSPWHAERRREEAWLRETGITLHSSAVPTPDLFTTAVMARIAQRQATIISARIPTHRHIRRGAPVALATLAVSIVFALISGFLFTLLAPNSVLLLLGTFIASAVALLGLIRDLLAMLGAAASNEGFMVALAAIPGAALVYWLRVARPSTDLTREA
ncbi:MAG: hypothetical protein OJF49_002776 [Ktedonobacterales bacterium]|nr:MAG: hypothetical protein OJF49_002776 [Ktedonobacterales bacterium]